MDDNVRSALMVAAAGAFGFFAKGLADWVKNIVRTKRADQVIVVGPTGEKMSISIHPDQGLDPTLVKKAILLKMLRDSRYEFRNFASLKSAIAADDEETKNLLLQIGARHNLRAGGEDSWTLKPLA